MKILGIETSCVKRGSHNRDKGQGQETSIKVLSNVVSSQVKLHAKYGGVVLSCRPRTC